jgi:hypothetical protein
MHADGIDGYAADRRWIRNTHRTGFSPRIRNEFVHAY